METINDRLEQIINALFKGNKAAFAKSIDLPPTGMSNYIGKKRRSIPSSEIASKIVLVLGVDANWLLTGEGEMLKDGNVNNVTTGDYSPVNLNGHMDVRQTVHKEERELELLRSIIAEKERIIETQQQLIDALRSK